MTIIFYLNEDFDGGETIFYPSGHDGHEKVVVKPEIGKVLIFVQRGWYNPLHEGAPHRSDGRYKYIIRSDLVYERVMFDDNEACCSPFNKGNDDVAEDSYDDPLSPRNCILL